MKVWNNTITSRATIVLILFIGLSVFMLLALHEWLPGGNSIPLPVCPLHHLTGLYCPGCGTTRAVLALMHGDLYSAFRYNPLFIFIVIIISFYALKRLMVSAGVNVKCRHQLPTWIFNLIPWVIIGYGILRNIPIYPFTMLAPSKP